MMNLTRSTLLVLLSSLGAFACDRDPATPDGAPIGYDQFGNPIYAQSGAGQPGYGQPGAGQPGYGQPGYGGATPPAAPPGPAAATPAAAPPSPLALPCQNDFTCGTHKCSLATQRCAFPCASAATDCAAGMGCLNGLCMPGAPAQ